VDLILFLQETIVVGIVQQICVLLLVDNYLNGRFASLFSFFYDVWTISLLLLLNTIWSQLGFRFLAFHLIVFRSLELVEGRPRNSF